MYIYIYIYIYIHYTIMHDRCPVGSTVRSIYGYRES